MDEVLDRVNRRFGGVELIARNNVFLVRARGYIGPSLIREELKIAAAFGESRSEGWWYVVDTTAVRVPNPLNALLLRQIRSLPHIRGYLVIAPGAAVRAGAKLLSWLVRPNAIVRDEAEAFDRVSRAPV